MNVKKMFQIVVPTACMLLSGTSLAASHSGQISAYSLNGTATVFGRGACIQMSPSISTSWACVWKDNYLYQETTDLLRDASADVRTCTIFWSATDSSGYAIIETFSCS